MNNGQIIESLFFQIIENNNWNFQFQITQIKSNKSKTERIAYSVSSSSNNGQIITPGVTVVSMDDPKCGANTISNSELIFKEHFNQNVPVLVLDDKMFFLQQ